MRNFWRKFMWKCKCEASYEGADNKYEFCGNFPPCWSIPPLCQGIPLLISGLKNFLILLPMPWSISPNEVANLVFCQILFEATIELKVKFVFSTLAIWLRNTWLETVTLSRMWYFNHAFFKHSIEASMRHMWLSNSCHNKDAVWVQRCFYSDIMMGESFK